MFAHEGLLDCEATNYNEENEDIESTCRQQPGHLIEQETPNLSKRKIQSDELIHCKEKGSEATIASNDNLQRLPYQSVGIKYGDWNYYGTGYVANLQLN
jgi:hypothetical protein